MKRDGTVGMEEKTDGEIQANLTSTIGRIVVCKAEFLGYMKVRNRLPVRRSGDQISESL